MKIGKINLSFWEIIIVMVVHWVVSSSELKIQELLQPGSPNSPYISILFYLFRITSEVMFKYWKHLANKENKTNWKVVQLQDVKFTSL